MSLRYFKTIFIITIIVLIVAGIYKIYIKDNKKQHNILMQNVKTKTTKEIHIGIINFDTLNPIISKNLEIQYINKLIYEPLLNITEDFNIEAGIAEEWSKLDELTYIIKINEDKKWNNGEKITIEDIQFTVDIIKTSDSIYKENVEQIDNIEKIDKNTFKIHLKTPIDFFEYLLCFPIVNQNSYNSNIPIGSGNFQITSIEENKIIIQNNETKLIIKSYRNATELYNEFTRGNVDLIITENTDYEKYIGNIGIEENIIIGREFYYISCENIKNIETRKHINQNINKEKIVYDLYNQKYVVVDFPLEYGSYLNKEKNIDSKEIYTKEKKNYTLSTNLENKEIAKKIKEQFEEKNITINVQNYYNPNADLILKRKTVPITPEISIYFQNQEIKQKIKEIGNIENKEVLKQEYNKIINEYYEEQPFISLFFSSYIILHTNKLKGDFSGNWYNIFYNVDTWYKVI